jgi:hypothetical protein
MGVFIKNLIAVGISKKNYRLFMVKKLNFTA